MNPNEESPIQPMTDTQEVQNSVAQQTKEQLQVQPITDTQEMQNETPEAAKKTTPPVKNFKNWFGAPKWLAFLLDWTFTIGGIIAFLFIIRTYIFIPFTVQGPSMEPTLHDREFIYVDKFTPLIQGYKRGDVIVFTPPQERMVQTPGIMCLLYKAKNTVLLEGKINPCLVQASFVKRIIGVGGDRVEVQNGNVYITPAGGVKTKVSETFLMEENKNKTCVPARECASIFSLTSEAGKDFGIVPENSYFVLGDNRLNSSDSRAETWGSHFIEKDHISGIVRMVYLTPPAVEPGNNLFFTILRALQAVPYSFSNVRWISAENLIGL